MAEEITAEKYGYYFNSKELRDLSFKFLSNSTCPHVDICDTGDVCNSVTLLDCNATITESFAGPPTITAT